MSLLGYDPARYYTGRAPIEAASMGIPLAADETAYRCNLVTLDYRRDRSVTMVDFSGGHISSPEAAALIAALEKACGNEIYSFHAGISYRHLLVVKDPVPEMTTVPPHDYIGKEVTAHYQAYLDQPGWNELVTRAREVLADHPINQKRIRQGQKPVTAIWPWGEGKLPSMPSLPDRFGISGTMISAVDLLKGLGICSALSVAQVEGATGYIDTNYEGKAQAAIDALRNQDFVFVHLEGPDEAGHQGRLDHKIQAIEDFDSRIVAPIIAALRNTNQDFRAAVTMDHFTPLAIQTHTSDPVPVLLYDSTRTLPGNNRRLNERTLSKDSDSNTIEGYKLMNLLLEKEG